jgi:sulfide:quinone oxidoreductase
MTRTTGRPNPDAHRVVIAGGGVAGVEAMLALRALAGDAVDVELVAPESHFWYRPLAVGEAFGVGEVQRFELSRIAREVGAAFTGGALRAVDPDRRVALVGERTEVPYDSLVVACGARAVPPLPGALTFRGPADSEPFRRLLAELESGEADSVAFVLPARTGWPLPLYELALLTGTHVRDRGLPVRVTFATHESEPLALFGSPAGDAVAGLFREREIEVRTGVHALSLAHGVLTVAPGEAIEAARFVTLPRLEGVPVEGLPQDAEGRLETDLHGRVTGVPGVYAAGDITTFPVNQGSVAAQQADAAAEMIAAEAGAPVDARPFAPVLSGILLTGREPLYLSAPLEGGHGSRSTVSREALWSPATKVTARFLGPFLTALVREHPDAVAGAPR